MRQRKDTRVHLVADLQKLATESGIDPVLLNYVIAEARAGEYHDFKNEKYPCGKIAVNEYLTRLGTPGALALAARVRDGEYDEPPDEVDKAAMAADLGDTAEGKALRRMMGLP